MAAEPLHRDFANPAERLGMANFFEQTDKPALARACLEEALHALRRPDAIFAVSLRLAAMHKRLGEWNEAVAIWQAQIESGPAGRIEAHVELAKYYEHQARDIGAAAEIVERALRSIGLRRDLALYLEAPENENAAGEETLESALLRRMRRLMRKKSGSEPRLPLPRRHE